MGLLDGFLGNGFEDPRSAAIMALSGGLLQGNFGAGLMGAQSAFTQAKQAQQAQETELLKRGLLSAQIDETKAQAAERQAKMQEAQRMQDFRQNLPTPEFMAGQLALSNGGGPTQANAQRMPQVSPFQSLLHQGAQAGAVPFGEYLKSFQAEKEEYSPTPQVVRDPATGQLVNALISKTGKIKVIPFGVKPDISLQDMGGSFRAIDKNSLGGGESFDRTGNPFTDLLLSDGKGGMRPNEPLIGAKSQVARAGAPNVNVNTDNLGLKPKDRFDMEDKLRNDYNTGTKLDQGIVSTAADISNILQQPGSLKDQAAIYKFAKALDPDGAVREADYSAIVKTAGGVEYLKALANKALTGEQLSPKQRAEMASVSQSMASVAKKRIAEQQKLFSGRARMYNLTPENVFNPLTADPAPVQPKPSPGANIDALLEKYGGK